MRISEIIEKSSRELGKIKERRAAFSEWLWSFPEEDDPSWHQAIRALIRIHCIFVREFFKDNIPLRASALTFTIVLSLVPMLALGTAVLKGLGAGDQARQAAYRLIGQMESSIDSPPTLSVENGAPKIMQPQAELTLQQSENDKNLTAHLRKAADQIFDYVDRTDFAKIGAFGIIFLIFAVVIVMDSIEASMNAIWLAESERPLGRKIMDYLALMILLPVTINLGLATEATLQSPKLLAMVREFIPVPGLEHLLLTLLPITLVVATFSILYRFIPNAKVKMLPALLGGLFAGICWFIVQAIYVKLQIGVARYNAIYGSFATVPLFLLWLQFGWIIFLAGAEMAFATQFWRHYRRDDGNLSPIARLALAYNIVEISLQAYKTRHSIDRTTLIHELRQPESSISSVLDDLVAGGILRRVDGSKIGFVPASPADTIKPAEIVDLIMGTEVPPFRGGTLASEVLHAARESVADKKIADF